MWLATTGDGADLAVCHLIRCSNSARLFFSCFYSKPVPIAAVFCDTATFGLNKTLLGFVCYSCDALIQTRGTLMQSNNQWT